MIVSFTGNRNTQKTSDICWRLHERIEDYIKLGCKEFLCGGAVGADTLFSLSVLKHKEKYFPTYYYLKLSDILCR